MSTSPKPAVPKRIIRGATVEGISFCPSKSRTSEPLEVELAKQHFELSKTLRKKISMQKIKAHELDEIWQAGIDEGYRKGLHEGQKQGYEAGKEEAFEDGFKEGAQQIRSELKVAVELTNKIANSLVIKKEELFEQVKPEIIKFSLAVCEKMLRKELSQSKPFMDLLESLLDQTKSILKDADIIAYLAPEDIAMLEKEMKNIGLNHSFTNAKISADPFIQRGNCRIETALGLVNFDINRLLSHLEERVLGIKSEAKE